MTTLELCKKAKDNLSAISFADEQCMNQMLQSAAAALRTNAQYIIEENSKDIENCTRGPQFIDRLMLNEKRIDGIAVGLIPLADRRKVKSHCRHCSNRTEQKGCYKNFFHKLSPYFILSQSRLKF